jgi:tetratricopeptide (TPR) repeat protein
MQKLHAGYYLQVLAATDNLYLRGGESVTQGLALFDLEVTNIQAGHDWVVAHQQDDNSIAEWCWKYPDAGVYCLDLRQHPRERVRWLEPAFAAAQRLKQRQWKSASLGNLGIAYKNLGEYRRAIEYYEQSLAIKREIGDRQGEANSLFNSAFALDQLGDRPAAIAHAEAALKIFEAIESPYASKVHDQLAKWRAEDQSPGQSSTE